MNLSAIQQLLPQLEPARANVIDSYEKRFRDATLSLTAASALAAEVVEVLVPIQLKAIRPRLTTEGFARIGSLLDSAKTIQRMLDTPGTSDVKIAIRAARGGRDDSEFDAACRAAELTLSRYEHAIADLRVMVGRLSAQLDLLDPAAIFSTEFTVSPVEPGTLIAMRG